MMVNNYTFYDVISRNARIYPEREAIVFGDLRLSYKKYKDQCDRIASGLIHKGVEKGDRIAIVARNSEKLLILYGAAAKIGAIILPVNWRLQPNEMEYIICNSRPKLMFVGSEYQKMIAEIVKNYSLIEKCYSIDQKAQDGFLPIDILYESNISTESVNVEANDGFVLMYTAAVHGKPRGALLSQGNILAVNAGMIDVYRLDREECNICFVPLFHIAGLAMCTAIMQNGGRNVIMDHFDAETTLQLIGKEKVTIFFTFSPILKMITDKCEEKGCDLSSVTKVAGIETQENIERFRKIAKNARFYTGYGQTEAMAITGGPMDEKPGSVGRPSILANVAIFDDNDNAVPVGTEGEICVRSPAVFCGYWENAEENSYTFRNGWHHTGDIGRFDEDGFVWYIKRKAEKDLIKPGGENVFPAEVEKAILVHESVAEVSVIGVIDSEWGEAIKSIVVLEPGKPSFTLAELTEFLASKIAHYKKPKHLVFVKSLPKTATGEIDREKVKKIYG